jgi:phage terminase large subunit
VDILVIMVTVGVAWGSQPKWGAGGVLFNALSRIFHFQRTTISFQKFFNKIGGHMQIKISPYPRQIEFFKSKARYTAYGGARGGGKSWAARTKSVLLASRYEGIQILLLRRSLKELRENHVLPLQSLLKDIAHFSAENKEFRFPNGARILLGYCMTEADVLQYQGQAYDVIFLEESTQFTEFQFKTLTESNRSSGHMKEKFAPRMYFTCNPGGVGHTWMKRLFIDKRYIASEKEENYNFIKSTVYENKYLMENNPEYVENLENLPEARKRAMLYGDWDAFEGQYFEEFDRDIHVVEPFEIPTHWDRYRTIDYGLDMLACYWIAVDMQGNAFVYKELYEPNLIISEAVRRIKAMTSEEIKITYAPPDLWNRRQDTGKSASEVFMDNGVYLVKSNNDRVQGWYNVKEWLRVYTAKHEQSGKETRTSKMKIWRTCTNLIRDLPLLQHDDKRPNDVANEPHELTHGADSIRYFCSMRFAPSTKNETVVPKYNFNSEKPKADAFLGLKIDDSYINFGR